MILSTPFHLRLPFKPSGLGIFFSHFFSLDMHMVGVSGAFYSNCLKAKHLGLHPKIPVFCSQNSFYTGSNCYAFGNDILSNFPGSCGEVYRAEWNGTVSEVFHILIKM